VFIFLVDDMGYNQVGYHAERVGNNEIKTLSIDAAAKTGIIMERGYMTPWCAPSRSSIQTGRTNSFNANVSNDLWAFDDLLGDGFVGGMPPGPVTIVKALKDYAAYNRGCIGEMAQKFFCSNSHKIWGYHRDSTPCEHPKFSDKKIDF
jgi:arylsulfatase A-like enzyme